MMQFVSGMTLLVVFAQVPHTRVAEELRLPLYVGSTGGFLDLDTADIECRRRRLPAKSSTWQTEASRISSDFILMRWRQLGSAQWYSKAAGDAPENKDT